MTPAFAPRPSRRRKTIAFTAVGALAVAAAGAPAAQAAEADCGYQPVVTPFVEHIDAAHLEKSPVQQVKDLMDIDNYTLVHTELVESMITPLLPTALAVMTPFMEHIDAAHLEKSPAQQAKDLVNLDDYVLIHTVLVENMLNPVVAGCAGGASAAPMEHMPGSPAAPAPAPAPAPATAAPQALGISGYMFTPKTMTVPVGTAVTWTNNDPDSHTVTSDSPSGPLKSKTFGMGGTYSNTFTSAGTYAYHCSVHPNMKATITVS